MSLSMAIALGYLHASIISFPFISWIMFLVTSNVKIIEPTDDPDKFFLSQWQVSILGVIERFLYLTSILVGKPEFIAVWLTMKTVYVSWSKKEVTSRRTFNNFLIGNGLSIFYVFAEAGFIQWASGLKIWKVVAPITKLFRKDMVLAWVSFFIPVVLSLFFIPILYYARRQLVLAHSKTGKE